MKSINVVVIVTMLTTISCSMYAETVIEKFFKGKTAEESASTLLTNIKFPRAINSDITLQNAYIHPENKEILVVEYKTPNRVRLKEAENFLLTRENINSNEDAQKIVGMICKGFLPALKNGMKQEVILTMADDSIVADIVVDLFLCESQ
jgi:hypothetical protein